MSTKETARAVVLTLVTFGTLNTVEALATPPVLSSADTMEKVFRDEPWTRPPASRLAVEAARNEVLY